MASPARLYQQEMHKNLGFFPTWFPGDAVDIGDVGILENGRFRIITTLHELGIECQIGVGTTTQDLQYTSTEGTEIKASISATTPIGIEGEINIEFSRDGAFVFNASGLSTLRLENRVSAAEQIVKVYQEKKWEKEWLLVESLYAAERTTIIVSNDSSAGLVLQASATGVSNLTASLVDPKVELKVSSTRGRLIHIVGGRDLHPLYSCLRITESWFSRKPTLNPVRGKRLPGNTPFEKISITELLNS